MESKNPFFYLADKYYRYRPTYPQEWYHYLAGLCDSHELAFDCATGNGQAALGLADHFKQVFAIDSSEEQIKNAFKMPNISYQVSSGEEINLPDHSVDLISVAQGIHWLNMDDFYLEAKRVMKEKALIAVWCYQMTEISHEIDPIIKNYAFEILKPFWQKEVNAVFDKYKKIPFPFTEVIGPQFLIKREWSFDDLINYLGTWSAVTKFNKDLGQNPISKIIDPLKEAWGDEEQRLVKWPLHYRIGGLPQK